MKVSNVVIEYNKNSKFNNVLNLILDFIIFDTMLKI